MNIEYFKAYISKAIDRSLDERKLRLVYYFLRGLEGKGGGAA